MRIEDCHMNRLHYVTNQLARTYRHWPESGCVAKCRQSAFRYALKKQGNEEANTNTNKNISNCTNKLPSLCFVCSYVAFFLLTFAPCFIVIILILVVIIITGNRARYCTPDSSANTAQVDVSYSFLFRLRRSFFIHLFFQCVAKCRRLHFATH